MKKVIDTNFSQKQYILIKSKIEACGWYVLPLYAQLLEEKKKCYPENIVVSAGKATVKVQDMDNHTARRIVEHVGN